MNIEGHKVDSLNTSKALTDLAMTSLEEEQKKFLHHLDTSGKSFNTIKNYRTDLNIFKQFLTQKGASFTLNELNELQVQEYDQFLNKKYNSPNSIRRRVQALRIFFDFLIHAGHFDENPIKKILVRPKIVDLPKPIRFDQIKKVHAHLLAQSMQGSDHEKLLIKRNLLLLYLIYAGGLKVSDIENLYDTHINEHSSEYRIIIAHEKRDPYTVLLPKIFNRFFPEYLADLEKGKNRDQVDFKNLLFNANPFKILKGGLSSRGIEVIFKELSKNLNLQMTAKSLRQAAIFNWINKGIPDSRIKEWMGVQPQYSLKPYKNLLEQYPERYPYLDLDSDS